MFRSAFWAAMLLGVSLATSVPVQAAAFTFSDPASIDSIGYTGFIGSYDSSGLQVVDTTDGFEVTGLLSITIDGPNTFSAGAFGISAHRFFDAPDATPASLTAHMNGTLSTTGLVSVYSLSTSTLLQPTPGGFGACGAGVAIDNGGQFIALPDGPFSASYTGNNINPVNPCLTVGTTGPFQNQLQQDFAVSLFFTGAGTITIDFGHSLLSEGTAAVPEPSSLILFGSALVLSIAVRRRATFPK